MYSQHKSQKLTTQEKCIQELKRENESLKKERHKLRQTLQEQNKIIWMAAEYASREGVFSPSMVNNAIDSIKNCGIVVNCDYVPDKILGAWIPFHARQYFRYNN